MPLQHGDVIITHWDADNGNLSLMFLGTMDSSNPDLRIINEGSNTIYWSPGVTVDPGIELTFTNGTPSFGTVFAVESQTSDNFWIQAQGSPDGGNIGGVDMSTGTYSFFSSIYSGEAPRVDLDAPAAGMDWAFYPGATASAADISAAYYEGATSGESYWTQVPVGTTYDSSGPPNTAPTGTNVPTDVTATEDTESTIDLSGITLADTENDLLTLKLTPSAGTLTAATADGITPSADEDGVSVLLDGTASALNAYLDGSNISYTGTQDTNGDNAATISASVSDSENTTNLGTINVDITAQNDAPTITGSIPDLIVTEDTPGVPIFNGVTVGDVDDTTVQVEITASSGTLHAEPGASSFSGATGLGAGTSTMTLTAPTWGHINTFFAYNGPRYRPAADSTDPAVVTVRAGDTELYSTTIEFDVTVTPENDFPTFDGVPTAFDGIEDTTLTLDLSGLSVGDVDGDELTVTWVTDNGRLSALSTTDITTTLSGDEKTVTMTGSAAELNAYLGASNVQYIPDLNDAGDDVAEITASLGDGTATVQMGIIPVHLEPENDEPEITGVPTSFEAVLDVPTSLDFSPTTVTDVDSAEVTVTIGALNATLSAPDSESIEIIEDYEDGFSYLTADDFAVYLEFTGSPEAINTYFDENQIGYTAADLYAPTFELPDEDMYSNAALLESHGGDDHTLEEPDLPPPFFLYEGMTLPQGEMFLMVSDDSSFGGFNEITVAYTLPEMAPQALNLPEDQVVLEDVATALDLGRLAIFDRNDDNLTVTLTASSGTLTLIDHGGDDPETGFNFNIGIVELTADNVLTLTGDTGEILEALAFSDFVFQSDLNSTDDVTIIVEATDDTTVVELGSFALDVEAVDDPASLIDDSFDTMDTELLVGDLFADNGLGADVDVDSPLAVTSVNGVDLATFNLAALSAGAGLTVNPDGTFSYHAGGPSEDLVAASTGASNTVFTENFTYGTADGAEAAVEIAVHGTATSGLLLGSRGADTITGGAGRDIVRAGEGADALDGGAGEDDWLDYRGSNEGVRVNLEAGAASGGHAEGDTFTGFERVVGSSHADIIIGDGGDNAVRGGSGNDNISAGAGNDVLRGDGGADFLDGGAGIDTADYSNETGRMRVDMRGVATGALGSDEDTLLNIERVVAGSGSDTLIGDDMDNALKGGAGRDSLIGGAGRDVLVGGEGGDKLRGDLGADVLIGDEGDDTFVFRRVQDSNLAHGVDQIRDFVSGEDVVQLDFVDDFAAAFIGDAAFSATGVAELRLRDTGDHLQLLGDMNGDGRDEFRLTFLNTETLSVSDFG